MRKGNSRGARGQFQPLVIQCKPYFDMSCSHNLQACARPRRQPSSRSNSVKPASRRLMLNLKEEQLMPRVPITATRRRRNLKASRKAKEARLSLQPRVVMSTLMTMPRLNLTIRMKNKNKKNLKKMIQRLMWSQPRLRALRVRWNQMACLVGPLAITRTTKSV